MGLGRLHSALSWLRKGARVLGSSKVLLGRLLQDTSPGQQGLCTQRLLSRMQRALDIVLADRLSSQREQTVSSCPREEKNVGGGRGKNMGLGRKQGHRVI